MTQGVVPAVFDFVDEMAGLIKAQKLSGDAVIQQDSIAMTFCESFFDQFFGGLGLSVKGFGRTVRESVGTLAEELRDEPDGEAKHKRRLIAQFEAFCDLYNDLKSDYGSATALPTHRAFHKEYLPDLLDAAKAWADVAGPPELASRIAKAQNDYHEAIGSSVWL